MLAGACPKLYYLDVELVVYRANRAGSLLNAGLAKHFAGIAAVIHRFEKCSPRRTAPGPRRSKPRSGGAPPMCSGRRPAALPAVMPRYAPPVPRPDRLQSTVETGDENTRPDWKLFAFLLNHFGPRFALWAAGLLKRK